MTDDSWRDRLVGARMAVDEAFEDRVAASSFSRQQWSLVMTATTFEIEAADDPERARIVANTDGLDAILPELDEIERQMGAMGGGGDRDGGTAGGGVLESITSALGLGDGDGSDDDHAAQRAEATELVEAYAAQLQDHLEANGRWESIREMAASSDDTT
ncbi:MAG: DUF5799 family protein [Halanaeroarchaeum sp.]